MSETTSRHALPLLVSGQAQKEITHNEALMRVDALAHPAIESRILASPPTAPLPGQIWLVAAGASGDWLGKASQLATWTSGGWRFLEPKEGMCVWSKADAAFLLFTAALWQPGIWPVKQLSVAGLQVVGPQQPLVALPSGGTTQDSQARTAIAAIIARLQAHGLIAT
jgi:hypothetical protein